ncbi:S41 family peptidase [Sandarakinorhabdus sp. DWP1-3-1]|uniref:S41 family peptidase n=1 Tax=Sandarakinorhabdus sp. DWP1-3-1 TaxID=2804627 RepID=UPI003CF6D57D
MVHSRTARQLVSALLTLALAGCGGGGSPGAPTGGRGATPTPTPTPTASCSLRSRQDWAAAQLREWYLFPETLPASLDPTPYSTVDDYIDALTATARAEGKDRFFTYLTSIAEENAYFSSGATAAFGIRLQTDSVANRLYVADAYEGAPALAAGIDRGAEILAIGTNAGDLRSVTSLLAAGGSALGNAFGPATPGVTRALQIRDTGGTRVISITKADFAIQPVSPRFGAQTLSADGQRIGYVNLRTFIETSEPQLRSAFDSFRIQGINQVIVDFRYNGGGLLEPSQVMADLLGANRFTSDVVNYLTYRPSKASENETRLFRRQPQAIGPLRIAFIATEETASASELVINAFTPYLKANSILVGADTYGKPVGQIAIDRTACDDRLRIVAFALQNADRQGAYYNGLASTVGASCQAADNVDRQMGDPAEASTKVAIDTLAGRLCVPIGGAAPTASLRTPGVNARERRELLVAARPNAAQRDLPGTF